MRKAIQLRDKCAAKRRRTKILRRPNLWHERALAKRLHLSVVPGRDRAAIELLLTDKKSRRRAVQAVEKERKAEA